MSDIRTLSLQRIQELCDEAEKAAMDIQQKVLFPANYSELKFEEVCQVSHKLREIKCWAEAIEENDEPLQDRR